MTPWLNSGMEQNIREADLPNGAISLDLIILQEKLNKYFYEYIQNLKKKKETKLRENFVYAMNIVCKV